MFKPLSELFTDTRGNALEGDIRVYIEQWLRRNLNTEQVYCAEVIGSRALIRVGSPLLFQEAHIRQYDLREDLKREVGYTLTDVRIVASYF